MATYTYRCPGHGPVEIVRSLGTAPRVLACPSCGAAAPRLFTVPALARRQAGVVSALDRAEQSRDAPAVVRHPPPVRRRRPAPVSPLLARLPRP